MPSYSSPGTENLRANATVKSASPNASPSGSGEDAGGTENLGASTQVKSNAGKSTPGGSKDNRPAGVSKYNGESV